MAVFPQGNPGETPLDPATEVGQFRLLFGDTNYEEYDPSQPGYGNYTYFSDAEIRGFLAAGQDNASRAIGMAYLQLAGAASLQSKNVKDQDLAIDLTRRAEDLRKTAQLWFDRADAEDDAGGEADFFDVIGFDDEDELIPEAMFPVYGRFSVRGRVR